MLTVSEKLSSDLYWQQYQYCVTIIQPKINILRGSLDRDRITAAINKRQYWEQQDIHFRLYGVRSNQHIDNNPKKTEYTEQVIADLHATAEYLKNLDVPYKLVFYGTDQFWLYIDSVELINTLQTSANTTLPGKITKIKKCLPVLPRNTIMLNDPKHQFRTYFKDYRITDAAVRGRLVSWIQEQQNAKEIAASPSVRHWIHWSMARPLKLHNDYTRSYWYIDHNHKSYETMMSLVCPGLVRKTVNLQRR